MCVVTLLSARSGASESNTFTFPVNQSSIPLFTSHSDPLITWAVEDFAVNVSRRLGVKVLVTDQRFTDVSGVIVSVEPGHPRLAALVNTPHGQWEGFTVFVEHANLHIVGADVRGAVYGLMTVAEKLGISPWQWWADTGVTPVLPEMVAEMGPVMLTGLPLLDSPAVKYRGVFLNDEDWGLLPWASNTLEPSVGNIGPLTYEKIFQLLLRLKANTIWPAMHPGTRAFFTVDGNKAMAERYQIHIGTSHAEPMMRNNVDEWDSAKRGEFDFVNNASRVNKYWESRVSELKDTPQLPIFTLGMRGVHDSHMLGTSSTEQSVQVLQNVLDTQRTMLSDIYGNSNVVKQVFTPYKEVLALYGAGLVVPDDVTLIWPDDNYGYIRRRSNANEQQRSGGSGVYYHLSYWGRPHDYLWLSTTHPALIQFEMARAYADGANQMWIANVGDIKPLEYNMEWFLHLGWTGPDDPDDSARQYLVRQFDRDFGESLAQPLANLMLDHYHLAFIRRPEFMGWSQTEPTTQTGLTSFTETQINQRLDTYEHLVATVNNLEQSLSEAQQSAWFQLVAYPVKGAAAMNRKWLYRHLASLNASPVQQQRLIEKAREAHSDIQQLTATYNGLNKGKWNRMMDASPRRLPVFAEPEVITTGVNVAGQRYKSVLLTVSDMHAPVGTQWRIMPELGYSRSAMTVFPLHSRYFYHEKPSISYQFTLEDAADVLVDVATLPTHANAFDHRLDMSLNGKLIKQTLLNTQGRSESWKQGVLTNRILTQVKLEGLAAGKYELTLAVNQTGIVVDEVLATMIKAGQK